MGPDEEVERDDKVTGADDVSDRGSETVNRETRDEKPVSIRDSLRAAIKEVDEKSTDDDADDKEDKEIKAPKKKAAKVEDDNDELDAGDDDTSKKEKETKVVKTEPEVKVEPKTPAPASLPKEVTENWDKLPSSVQTYLAKAQKDLTDTKSALGRREAQYRDMDAVLAPHEPEMRRIGVTPAQTVERLFQWMNALTGPNKQAAIRQLANDFGINLEQQQDDPSQTATEIQQAQLPAYVEQNLNALQTQVAQLNQQQNEARARNAAQTVNSWAGLQADGTYKNKPHYGKVRLLMGSLMASGAVPMIKDEFGEDRLDLDGAYEAACYSNPEVRALIEQEKQAAQQEKAKADLEAKKAKEQEKIAKAKKASVGIKPGAPSANPNVNPAPKKNANGTISVRDSLRHAIREAAGT